MKWSFEAHPPGWINDELQAYTNKRLENARLEVDYVRVYQQYRK
jgi:hypothetical protein